MIVGVGIDVLETRRMERALGRPGFEQRVFTARERSDCAERRDRTQALAARFAAKEACLKALGMGWGVGLGNIEVLRSDTGAPVLQVQGQVAARVHQLHVNNIQVSLTHQPQLAAAVVILETTGE